MQFDSKQHWEIEREKGEGKVEEKDMKREIENERISEKVTQNNFSEELLWGKTNFNPPSQSKAAK